MIKNFFKGMAIGVANVLPGVSGGTLAIVLNIYDNLTEAIGNFFTAPKLKKIEYLKFLTVIGLGAAVGIIIFAGIVTKIHALYPKSITLLFILLILSTIPLILKGENFLKRKNILAFIYGLLFTFAFIFLAKLSSGDISLLEAKDLDLFYGIKLFICGVISAAAMIIPGISGSMLLIILGEYYTVMHYIKTFDILPLVFFATGAFLGLIFVSRIINVLLSKYRSFTLHFIVGIVIASLFEMAKIFFI